MFHSQRTVSGPAASASPGDLWERLILSLCMWCTESEKLGGRPSSLWWKGPPCGSDAFSSLTTRDLEYTIWFGIPCWPRWQRICLQCRCNPWVRKIPWRREWLPSPVFLPRKSHGQASLVGLQFTGSQRDGHNWATNNFYFNNLQSVILKLFTMANA